MVHSHRVYVDCGFTLTASLTRHSIESMGITPGKDITAVFKATAVHAIHINRRG
jgi:molybdopterin-binding protein